MISLPEVFTPEKSFKSTARGKQLPESLFQVGKSALQPGYAQTWPSGLRSHVEMVRGGKKTFQKITQLKKTFLLARLEVK